MQTQKAFVSLWLISFLFQVTAVSAQQIGPALPVGSPEPDRVFREMWVQFGAESISPFMSRLFGSETENAANELAADPSELIISATKPAAERANEWLEEQIAKREERSKRKPEISPAVEKTPANKRPAGRRRGFVGIARPDWRAFAFGFRPWAADEPVIRMSESDKEIKAEGSQTKNFETKEAKGTSTQKAETRYTKDGKTFGVEIKNTRIIDAVSKPDGKSFRQEISMVWGAEVAACPDINGVSAGTGSAKVVSKTTYTEDGVMVTMTSEFDLRAKLSGQVNDQAEIRQYDMQLETTTTNSGYGDAFKRGLIKEIKLNDGTYELDFDIPGNTLEISDGKYGGQRTPAKIGKTIGRKISQMPDADAKTLGSAIGPMVPSIWNSANEMYKAAERSWRNYGCVEVTCRVPKTTLKEGEKIDISTETVHLQDGSKINALLTGEAYPGEVTPESQNGKPAATFTFTNQATEDRSTFTVRSASKRGIGQGEVEFQIEKEKDDESVAGLWTGTIRAERKQRQEKEKRSGANLAENGGHMETATNVRLQLTGRLDRTVDATNAYIANVSGLQQLIDFEYDRYKIDEGYCGPNAVPYKGPKEITRTSTTTANYNSETRVYVEIGGTGGTITFSLPEINGTTVHKYVHKSPCSEHDRANTSEATDDEAPTVGGSFSFSFPIEAGAGTVKGSVTVPDEDGGSTTYTWELTRRRP
jgi:hypothetical protein